LIGTVRDEAGNRDKDRVIEVDRVAKDISKDAEALHLGQRVLHHDADAREGGVLQFLLRDERMSTARRMATRRRKTLIVCRTCHEDIHAGRPTRQQRLA